MCEMKTVTYTISETELHRQRSYALLVGILVGILAGFGFGLLFASVL